MDKKVLRNLSYGMYIVGTVADDKKVGCICNTVVQITSDPMTVAISINHNNYTNEMIKKTKKFSISILDEDTDQKIISTFGYESSRYINKYENIETLELDNLPILKSSCGALICEVIDILETTTHTVFLGKIIHLSNYTTKNPMTYRYYHEILKGKSPKNAPTYIEEQSEKQNYQKTKWRCKVCGYEVEMDKLPEDFVCPICGKPVIFFEKIEK